MGRHRSASSEYSTRWTGESESFTVKRTVVRLLSRVTDVIPMTGGALSTSKVSLSRSATSAAPGGLAGASEARTFRTYVPFGTDVVSQTNSGSDRFRFSTFHVVSPSRRYWMSKLSS